MKYIILLGDGMADNPADELGGKTPLEYAATPHMDCIASMGTAGLIDTIPQGFPPGSDVANLSVLGYDPHVYHSGRAPLEAASIGISLLPDDVAFRCNLVTLGDGEDPVMEDYSAGHISSQEAGLLIDDLNAFAGSDECRFYSGVSYRNIMVWKGGSLKVMTTPPHDIVDQHSNRYLPQGDAASFLVNLVKRSRVLFRDHRVNRERVKSGKRPASSIWLWGEGKKPRMSPISDRYPVRGGLISAVDLLRGIGYYAGLELLHVDGATGYIDTNYEGKAAKALEFLTMNDFVFLHVEAPDEMSHEGNMEGKIRAIEDFDRKIVGTILGEVGHFGDHRIAVMSDHPTPFKIRTHASDPSPFAVYSSRKEENIHTALSFGETEAKKSSIVVTPGYCFMDGFLGNWRKFIGDIQNKSARPLC
jgi:2,3-bisphosphoglycerate-independent phosphoglycerate mutase